jgi:selenocysteine-specific elongation factor
VKRIVVALTKSDLGKIEINRERICDKLRNTPFASAPIVPTSVQTTAGIEELKKALAAELAQLQAPRDIGKLRLFVDRAFTLHGIGTVVTGTLSGGTIKRGQTITIQPRNISTRVRSIQTHGRDVDQAQPGMRTAINLPELGLDQIKRGDAITAAPFEPTATLDVILERSSRLQRAVPIKSGAAAYVHHGTTRVSAKIIFAETGSLAAGESAVAQLRLDAPLLAFVGDRLIIRDASEQRTVAGGVVINVDPIDSRSRKERALLASRAVAPDDVALAVWTEISAKDFIEPAHLLERSNFNGIEITRALERLAEHGEIFLSENVGAKMLLWRELRQRAAQFIDAAHKAHPERRGLELNDLRNELSSISPAVFDALIVDLCQTDFVRTGSTIARRAHHAKLPAHLQAASDKIRATLSEKPFDPPSRTSFYEDRDLQQALRFLIEQQEVIELNSEIVLTREAAEQMRNTVITSLSKNARATASQLRQEIGTSRRVIIPFLEYLDRIGVTQRVGDERVLAKKASVVKITDAANAPPS